MTPRRLLAGLALGATLAAGGVLSVVPESWSVALTGQSVAASADPPIRVVAPPPTTERGVVEPAAEAPEQTTDAVDTADSAHAAAAGAKAAADSAARSAAAATEAAQAAPSAARTTSPLPTAGIPVATGPEARVVALTNDARARVGCDPLRTDDRITAAAEAHSADMAAKNYFAHDSLDGRTFVDRLTAAGYPDPGAENIAMGQDTADEVVAAWLDSPGHRRNIEDCSLRTIGVGLVGEYWTQDFGR